MKVVYALLPAAVCLFIIAAAYSVCYNFGGCGP